MNWLNVAESCGPYEATEVYSATDLNGPFTLLDEINDAAATSYSDPNPAGQLRYYYLRYRYNCPGQVAMNSDTLDSFIPVAPVIQYVGIEGNEIVIDWLPSISPEVTGYVILEVTPTTFIPLDTVQTVTEYRLPFTPADPNAADRQFLIVALDPCNNDSPQSSIVKAAYLNAVVIADGGDQACIRDIELEVDQRSIGSYLPATALELFVSVNGAPFASAGTAPPSAISIVYGEANDGENLCFYLEAILANNFGRARSEIFCQEVDFNQPVVDFPLYGVEIDETGNLLFQYEDNPLQPVPTDERLVITRTGSVLEFVPLLTPVFGSGGQLIAPPLAQAISPGETFSFRVTDDCSREVTTNAVEPVYLTVRALIPGQNQLTWSPLINGLDGDITYDVFRLDAGTMPVALANDLTDLSFVDNNSFASGAAVCYEVRARFRPTGSAESFVFSSNQVCVTPVLELFIPNAFSPNGDGVNDVFRPFFSSPPPPEGFLLQIWDRWGSLIHETEDPLEGWDGDNGLQPVSVGTYLYILQYTAGEGNKRQRSGTFNLLK